MSTTRRELLVIILALEKYAYYASGRQVIVYSYHKALSYLTKQQMIPHDTL